MKNKDRTLLFNAPEGCNTIDNLRSILNNYRIVPKFDLFGITFSSSLEFYQTEQAKGLNIREPMGFFMGSYIIWNISLQAINDQLKIKCIPKLDLIRLYAFIILFGIAQLYCIISFISSSNSTLAIILQTWIVIVVAIVLFMVQTEYKRGYALLNKIFG